MFQASAKDTQGRLWFGSSTGGILFTDGRYVQQITSDDGLPGNGITGIHPQADGKITVLTGNGIVRYDAHLIRPPSVEIRQVTADKVYNGCEHLTLTTADTDLFTISFKGHSFATRRMRYSFILEGYDQTWRHTWSREVCYENLPSGEYTFKVIAINHVEDGRLTLAAYSAEGGMIPAGDGVAVLIPVTLLDEGRSNPVFTLEQVVLADPQANTVPVTLGETSVKVSSQPTAFSLQPNVPNPFNPSTAIVYEVQQQAHITLIIYNLIGQEVARLVDRVQPVGRYNVVWNARNALGRPVSSGVYLYRLTTDTGHSESRRMTLLK